MENLYLNPEVGDRVRIRNREEMREILGKIPGFDNWYRKYWFPARGKIWKVKNTGETIERKNEYYTTPIRTYTDIDVSHGHEIHEQVSSDLFIKL